MKKLSKKMKQLLTLMLAVAMIVTAVPQTGMQVSAAGLEVAETGETSITQETPREDVEEESNEESKDEGDSDNRTEETPENEDENLGGGITDEEDVEENPSDENQDASDSDADSSDSDDEPAGEELEDEKTEDEEIEDEEIPENETGEDEASETEDDVSDSVQDNKENSIMTMAVDDKFTVDGSGKLTAYEGSGGDITIPDGVITIGFDVFQNNTTITSVIFF